METFNAEKARELTQANNPNSDFSVECELEDCMEKIQAATRDYKWSVVVDIPNSPMTERKLRELGFRVKTVEFGNTGKSKTTISWS